MNNTSLISVIIPVYNIENYLKRCIESILQQTYQEIEIILVDDGSKDKSGKICDAYADKDARIRVIHQKKSGPGGARNSGLEIARGSYVAFVDGDDYFTEDYLEYLYKLLTGHQADMSACELKKIYSEAETLDEREEKVEILTSEEALRNLLCQKKVQPGVGCKLYKKEVFDGIQFPVARYYEDLATIYKILEQCEKIAIGKKQKYYYFQRKNSIMNQKFSEKKMYRIQAANDLKIYIDQRYPQLKYETSVRCLLAGIQVFREIPKEKEYQDDIEIAWKQIKTYRVQALKSRNVKFITRMMILSSYLGKNVLAYLGKIYSIVFYG